MFTISYQGILTPKLTVEYLLAVVRWPLWPFLTVLNVPGPIYGRIWLHHPVSLLASVNASGLTALCLRFRK